MRTRTRCRGRDNPRPARPPAPRRNLGRVDIVEMLPRAGSVDGRPAPRRGVVHARPIPHKVTIKFDLRELVMGEVSLD